MAPTPVPMKNGVSNEEKAKVAPAARCWGSRDSSLRKANPGTTKQPRAIGTGAAPAAQGVVLWAAAASSAVCCQGVGSAKDPL